MKNLKNILSYVHKFIRYYEGGSLINIGLDLCMFLICLLIIIISSATFLGIIFHFS